MKGNLLIFKLLILAAAQASAGGSVGEPNPCTMVSQEIIASAPIKVYLPDGNTEMQVGEASVVSSKSACPNERDVEVLDIKIQLKDKIEPYGINLAASIIPAKPRVTLDFDLKQLVNTTKSFETNGYGVSQINHFTEVGQLKYIINEPDVLFWMNPKLTLVGQVRAELDNGQERALACSFLGGTVTLTITTNPHHNIEKDLELRSFIGASNICNQ